MSEGRRTIDLSYLGGVFEPDKLEVLSSRLLEVIRNVGLVSDHEIGGSRPQDEINDACNVLLDPIGLKLLELEPHRYGLVCREQGFSFFEEVHFSRDSDAILDAALLASWLLRSGRVHSLHLASMTTIMQPLSAVIKATLPFCSGTLRLLKFEGSYHFHDALEDVLHGAESLEALESLHLMNLTLTPGATLPLGRLLLASSSSLQVLSIHNIHNDMIVEGREIVAGICQCLNLTSLDLGNILFDGEELELFHDYIKTTHSLQFLSIVNCDQRECRSMLHALRSNRSLRKAEFCLEHEDSECLGEQVANVVKHNTTLESLSLNNLSLTSRESFACVFAALRENKTLKHFGIQLLELLTRGLDETESVSDVAAVIRENKTLESLHIEWRNMTNYTMKLLAQALATNPAMRVLRIGTCDIQDEDDSNSFREAVRSSCDRIQTSWNHVGLEELATVLPQSSVETLYLSWQDELKSPPIVPVLKGLCANRTITRLRIDSIARFSAVEIAILADYLRSTAILKSISIGYGLTHPVFGIPLIDAVAENASLCRVDFGHFDMDNEACQHFAIMLMRNRTLQWVSQDEHCAGSEELEHIANGLECNYTLLGLTLGRKPPSPAWPRIRRALAANGRRLNRAVSFVLGIVMKGDNSQCEEAFRVLFQLEALREELAEVTSSSATRVEELIEAARRRLPESNL